MAAICATLTHRHAGGAAAAAGAAAGAAAPEPEAWGAPPEPLAKQRSGIENVPEVDPYELLDPDDTRCLFSRTHSCARSLSEPLNSLARTQWRRAVHTNVCASCLPRLGFLQLHEKLPGPRNGGARCPFCSGFCYQCHLPPGPCTSKPHEAVECA